MEEEVTQHKDIKWPKEGTLRRVDKLMSKAKGAATLPPDAGPTLRFKFDLARQIVEYMNDKDLSQREMAKVLGIHEARISEIVHYRLGRVMADTLMGYVERLNKKTRFKVA